MREGWTEPRKFEIVRAIIKIDSVSSELLSHDIGYVRIKSFQKNTYEDLDSHMVALAKKNKTALKGLVLDLRNNPGGLLDQAILVSDRFIKEGPLVITVTMGEGNQKRDVREARARGTESELPVVVLVNGGSASASEIVSGAIKNHDRGLVVGQQTFGKGSVQVLYEFQDRSALKLTIAQYLTPGDVSIQSVGIQPDVAVAPVSASAESIRLFGETFAMREKDLDKHLEHNRAELAKIEMPRMRIPRYDVEDEGESSEPDAAGLDKFEMDFEITLAQDILHRAASPLRSRMLQGADTLLQERRAQELEKISARLATLGVDWSAGDNPETPLVSVSLATNAIPGAGFVAGNEMEITATVQNRGATPLTRLFGITESDHPFLNRRELVFGRIEAGQSRTWSTKIKIPADLGDRGDRIVLHVHDPRRKLIDQAAVAYAQTLRAPSPQFSYWVTVDDTGKGNGDGLLQVGEDVFLDVHVTNVGEGSAGAATAAVKNLSDTALYLEEGRVELGALPAGGARSGRMHFSVREARQSVKLRVSVWDDKLVGLFSDDLELPIQPPKKVSPDSGRLRCDGDEQILAAASAEARVIGSLPARTAVKVLGRIGAEWMRIADEDGTVGFLRHAQCAKGKAALGKVQWQAGQAAPSIRVDPDLLITSLDHAALRGTVRDQSGLEDFFVFVNDRKVHYQPLLGLQGTKDGYVQAVDLQVPLEKGPNLITLVARENEQLVGRHVLAIFRKDAEPVAATDGAGVKPN
jgi:carboxyl-terminal processing protease